MSTAVASPSSAASSAPSKGLHYGLWAAQILLALAFGMAGVMKTTTPIAELGAKMPWVLELPNLVRFIGASELLAVGLILPSATRILPKVTVAAALGLVTVMVLAAGFHVLHGEASTMAPSLVLGALAAFVAWGRFKKAPIAPRA